MPENNNTESVDPLEEESFDEATSYDIGDRLAGTKQIERALSAVEDDVQAEKSPESEKGEPEPELPPYSFWSERRKLALMFGRVHLKIFVIFLAILSIYWGALHHREYRVKNMKMLVVIDDSSFSSTNSTTLQPLLGDAMKEMLQNNTYAGTLAHYVFGNNTELRASAEKHNVTLFGELTRKIHQQEYWAGFYINETASQLAFEALASGTPLTELQYLVNVVYETGRHVSALSQYVLKNLRRLEALWLSDYVLRLVYAPMVQYYLTADEQESLANQTASLNSTSALLALPRFNLIDHRPTSSSAALGPSELGLIYAQVFSFHQFNFSNELHANIKEKLRFRHYLLYRIFFSQVNYLALLLVYALITIAFRVPVNVAFGDSGFLVLWFTMFLFISASGGLNENVGSMIMAFDKKVLLAPFMISNIVINITPTFAPFVLSPGFYRYGYAMPMYNAYEALKVLFFNTWPGHLGRNYGILVLWIGVTNISLCFALKFISDRAKRQFAARRASKT